MENTIEEINNNIEEQNKTEQTNDSPNIEMTEEEAKVASKNVSKLLDFMNQYKSPQVRLQEKIDKYKKEYDELADDNYKKAQLDTKIKRLEKKLHPDVFWDSSKKGTYKKDKEIK